MIMNDYEELLKLHRRNLHMIPELDRDLPETKKYLLSVLEQLNALHAQWGIDEFIIDTPIAEGATRVQSLRLLAEARLNREVTV